MQDLIDMKQKLEFAFDGDVVFMVDVDVAVQDPGIVDRYEKRLRSAVEKAIEREFGKKNIYVVDVFVDEGEWSDPV